jgi:hypothetical protein
LYATFEMKSFFTYVFLLLVLFTSCVNTYNKSSTASESNERLLGFWRFVKIMRGSAIELYDTEDIYFTSDYWYELDYPICFNRFKYNYSVQGDSLFRYSGQGTFKHKIAFNGDTLIISDVYKIKDLYESRYFIRSTYDSIKLNEILTNGFNPDSLRGIFKYQSAYDNEDIVATDIRKIEAECPIIDTIDLSINNRKNFSIRDDTLVYIHRNYRHSYKIEEFQCIKCIGFREIHLSSLLGDCDQKYSLAYKMIK